MPGTTLTPLPLNCLSTAVVGIYPPVAGRYERGSNIFTSDKGLAEWGDLLCVTVVSRAILDRLLQRSLMLNNRGFGYRLREKQQAELQFVLITDRQWTKPSSRESQAPK